MKVVYFIGQIAIPIFLL